MHLEHEAQQERDFEELPRHQATRPKQTTMADSSCSHRHPCRRLSHGAVAQREEGAQGHCEAWSEARRGHHESDVEAAEEHSVRHQPAGCVQEPEQQHLDVSADLNPIAERKSMVDAVLTGVLQHLRRSQD